MVDVGRARRLSKRIGSIVASAIEFEIKDPPLAYITVTDTKVTGDLHDATVFYTVFGAQDERQASAQALESAKGVLRSEVGRQTGVRFTPTLAFVLDSVPDTAKQIEDLLAVAAQADAEVDRARRGARPAGDADPYRKPREDDGTADAF